ncbi:PAM68-like protein [Actinidia rufa]|uniref:PAM68-like protein n=1 Tax=Actinidia rufa TaxID=165716 RepID=A0A7J0GGJ7_9ERIC|nr:PAM68-like protein [Actinidia rufa]
MKATINSQFSVERFDGNSSFTLWQRRVKDILVQQGLAKALKGKDAKPETMKDDDWEELMMKCVSTIRLCIADNIINNVMDEDSASALWEKLEKLYLAKSLTNKLHMKRQLYRLKMEKGGSLMEHMNVFNGYLDQLRKVDVKIDEEDKALLLLTSLPDSYDTLVTTLLYGKDTVSLEQVKSSLVFHCTQKRSSFEDGESAALAVQSGNRGKKSDGRSGWSNGSSSSSRGKGVQCYYCKEFGHVKRDCPLRKDKGKKCNDASSCNSLVVADDGDCLTVSEERDGGSLFLGDGTPCKIQGIGNVKIKIFDGAVLTLGGVVYIPKLRRNLISLSRMDSNGCKYFARGGAMKITCGGKVLMKGEKCEGLYRLIGKTVYLTKVWKRCAQRSGYPRCESFAAKTKLCFQVADGCEGVTLVGREDGSREREWKRLDSSHKEKECNSCWRTVYNLQPKRLNQVSVYVENLLEEMDVNWLHQIFGKFGQVTDVFIPKKSVARSNERVTEEQVIVNSIMNTTYICDYKSKTEHHDWNIHEDEDEDRDDDGEEDEAVNDMEDDWISVDAMVVAENMIVTANAEVEANNMESEENSNLIFSSHVSESLPPLRRVNDNNSSWAEKEWVIGCEHESSPTTKAAAAISFSLSSEGIRNRNRLIQNEAQATWLMGKTLGLDYEGTEKEVVSKVVHLEMQDEAR